MDIDRSWNGRNRNCGGLISARPCSLRPNPRNVVAPPQYSADAPELPPRRRKNMSWMSFSRAVCGEILCRPQRPLQKSGAIGPSIQSTGALVHRKAPNSRVSERILCEDADALAVRAVIMAEWMFRVYLRFKLRRQIGVSSKYEQRREARCPLVPLKTNLRKLRPFSRG